MLRKVGFLLIAAALGAGSSIAVGACGEDRGTVSVEDGGTGTGKSGKTSTSTTPTESTPTETEKKPGGSGGY